MAPIVYHTDISPPGRAVLLTASALGLDVDVREVDIFAKQHLTKEFLKFNCGLYYYIRLKMSIFDNCLQSINRMNRRKLIIWGSAGTIAVIILIIIIAVTTGSETTTVTRGSDALQNFPLIDGHNDLPNNLRMLIRNNVTAFHFESDLTNDSTWGSANCGSCFTDIPRLRKGKLGAQFWVAYVDCNRTQYKDAVAETFEQIDVIRKLIRKYPNDLQFVTAADDIEVAFQNGKIGSLIGVEGGHSIDSRLGVLRTFYDLGVRYMTLTHTCNTPWADASPTAEAQTNNNLTEFGQVIVKEMNRLGMMVDLSHVSRQVMLDALNVSRAPVMFSHSSAFNITQHHRNVDDVVLEKVKENNGIVMVNFYPGFIAPKGTKDNTNISTVIEHINYIANKIGVDYVGIGADYDGVGQMPKGLDDVSKYPDLFDALHAGYSNLWSVANLEKLAGRNLVRVFKEVEKVRDNLSNEIPYDNWISKEDLDKIEEVNTCRNPADVANPQPQTTQITESTTVPSTSVNTASSTNTI
ncbi:uncharacterized protein CBL_08069 [Carabus blaptoides fortunei]